jgi:menaquinone-dependent protoporphyrinogen oxidase
MPRVLIVVASRHGATRGIAERVGEVLRAEGCSIELVAPDEPADIRSADAVLVGSAIYLGSWQKPALAFLASNSALLARRPVWLFSSGPLAGSTRSHPAADALTEALGPAEGPGSRGRQEVAQLAAAVHARGHEVFLGAFRPDDPPRTVGERLIRLVPMSKGILPAGDFRQWDVIEAWARGIAADLRALPITTEPIAAG